MAKARLLVVEDEPAVSRALTRVLRHAGYEVDVALSHAESLAYFEQYDCGVFDISLPDSDGVELAVRLRQRGIVKGVIFFSGVNEVETEVRARREGVFVHKAEGVARLKSALDALLSS